MCVAVGYAAYILADRSWESVVAYQSPYTSLELPEGESGRPIADRVVLVIVDGLRLDVSRQVMPTLDALRRNGADFELNATQPSLTSPNRTTILSGAEPWMSGVVTNWHEGAAPVETLFDTARRAGAVAVAIGPTDLETLYGVEDKCVATYLREWDGDYLSGRFVDETIRLTEKHEPRLVVVHLPDIDEVGHEAGGTSSEYAGIATRVDEDLRRLVEALQAPLTSFVVVADHGHIDSGGHGGWEREVTAVPGVLTGPSVLTDRGVRAQAQIAPTVARLAGIPAPRHSLSQPLYGDAIDRSAVGAGTLGILDDQGGKDAAARQAIGEGVDAAKEVADAMEARLVRDRGERLPAALAIAVGALLAIAVVGAASWRALVSASIGTLVYYATYNTLFFLVHGYRWSLSSFNSEELIESWMNLRLIETAVCGMLAVLVAGVVYPLLRQAAKPSRGSYLAGWLALGPATILVLLATLALQVAWFVWAWGIFPEWGLPDLKWGFKYDLDLVQATALGFSAVLAPLVTWLVGRYHPRVRRPVKEQ